MRSPAAAIGWQFRRRHRWGFAALAGYFAVLAVVKLAIVASGRPVTLESPARFAIAVPVPLAATFTYLLAVFSFGLSGDLAARPSIYPARMFTLPVTTAALAGWPMLYGTAVMAIVWLATRLLVLWPSGVAIPVVWPAFLAAVLLAWTQALTWMPYGLPGVRVALALLWLVAIDTVVLLALYSQASEAVMLAILAPLLPLAYPVARLGVARARRGEVPDWRGRFIRPAPVADPGQRERRHSGPSQAQAWFEWRRHGRSLPLLVAVLLPFELALLWAADGAPALVWLILLGVALTPPFMATLAAATVRTAGATPFLATRPLSSAALVAAKLKMAMWSTLAAWGVVLIAVPLGLELSGTSALIVDRARDVAETLGTPRAVTAAALGIAALLGSTFTQLVQSLYIGLSGRAWVVRTSLFLALSFLVIIGPLVLWIGDHVAVVWRAVPWILAVLAALKLAAAGWVATRLHSAGLVSDGTLVAGAAGWAGVVLALHAVLLWLVDTPFIPNYLLLLIAILATPLARLAAAPVALAWNRHR